MISTNEVLVVNCHKYIDGRKVRSETYDFNKSLLVVITDSWDKDRLVPDENISFFSTGNGSFSSRDVDGLSVVDLEFFLSSEISLFDWGRVGFKFAALGSPGVEQDAGFTVTDDFVILVRVKFNPELVLVSLRS